MKCALCDEMVEAPPIRHRDGFIVCLTCADLLARVDVGLRSLANTAAVIREWDVEEAE